MQTAMVRSIFLTVALCLTLVTGVQAQFNLKGLGKALGLDEKTSDILDKSFKTIRALAPIGYKEEKAIGGALAVEVFQRFGGPYNNPRLLRYVTLVGTSVAAHSDRPNIPYYFALLNNAQPNAFATPGGYVFLTIGLLRQLRSEAELAGVLGHEIAHITAKHALKTLQRSQILHGVSQLTVTALDKDPAMFDQIINELSATLFERGLDQKLEYAADRLGVEYAYRVGYNPQGLRSFLRRLAQNQRSRRTGLFKTHPDPRRRADLLQQTMLQQYGHQPGGQTLQQRFVKATKQR